METHLQQRIEHSVTNGLGYDRSYLGGNLRFHRYDYNSHTGKKAVLEDRPIDLQIYLGCLEVRAALGEIFRLRLENPRGEELEIKINQTADLTRDVTVLTRYEHLMPHKFSDFDPTNTDKAIQKAWDLAREKYREEGLICPKKTNRRKQVLEPALP